MPKVGQSKLLDKETHIEGVNELLKAIAKRGDKRRGDVVIAYEEDISVYAVRMWFSRPIPKRHWKTLAKLSGFSVDKIEKIATGSFNMNAIS
ncbi:hypothetical protein EBZ39_10430 [bacterium]|nr:hypothetical protein [bacterium]